MVSTTLLLALFAFSLGAVHTGYLKVNKPQDANLFYYFVESQSNPAKDPVILWLQGGPGCSSLFGAFVENGPQLIQEDGTFKNNPYTWASKANVIWIDSPVGTGFSYVTHGPYAADEQTIATDLFIGLKKFLFELYPQYNSSDFYIFGESYAGKYVPWLAHTILSQSSTPKINLKGVGIGDGWTYPYYQTGSYGPYLYRHGLIGDVGLEFAAGEYETYKGLVDVELYTLASVVGNTMLSTLMLEAGVNDPYDITKPSDPTDPLSDALTTYLNLPATQRQFGVNTEWTECANGPNFALSSDEARSAEFLIPQILSSIPVLLYNGNNDLICNMDGTATWASLIDWPGQQQFNRARNQTWTVSGKVAGSFKTYSTLTLLVVNGAGHMVPYDQPQNAHDMLYRFISGGFKP